MADGSSNPVADTTSDSDGDGMFDCRELAQGLDLQVAGDIADDPDGDCIFNIGEHQQGTDPQSWNDFWSVMSHPFDTSKLTR